VAEKEKEKTQNDDACIFHADAFLIVQKPKIYKKHYKKQISLKWNVADAF